MALDITPNISFSFKNGDMEGLKNRALIQASKNAKAEAEAVVGAVGCRLGALIKVERDVNDHGYVRNFHECDFLCNSISAPMLDIDIDPEDVRVTDEIVMVWEIEG